MSNKALSSNSLPCLLENKGRDLLKVSQCQSQPLIAENVLMVGPEITQPACSICNCKNCSSASSGCLAFSKADELAFSSSSEMKRMDKAHYLCSHKGPLILARSGDHTIRGNFDSVSVQSNVVPMASIESLTSEYYAASDNLSLIVPLVENKQETFCNHSSRCTAMLAGSTAKLADGTSLMCRICHSGEEDEELIEACRCAGTVKFAHQSCLLNWISKSGNQSCELCRYKFRTRRRKVKYFWKWQFPEVSTKGYLHIGLFIAFITMLLTSVIWIIWSRVSGTPTAVSERTTEEVKFAYMLNGLFIALALGGLYFDSLRHMKRYFKRWSVLNQHTTIEQYSIEKDKTRRNKKQLNRKISGISVGVEATETDATSVTRNFQDNGVGTWV